MNGGRLKSESLTRQQRRAQARAVAKIKKEELETQSSTLHTRQIQQESLPSPQQQSLWQRFLNHLQLYLAILASLVAIISTSWLYSPRLTIGPTVSQTAKTPSSVDFTVTNAGRVTAYSLVFGCTITNSKGQTQRIRGNMIVTPNGTVGQRLEELLPGRSATRSCDIGISLPNLGYPASFDFNIDFVWPFIGKHDSVTRHFTSRPLDAQHVLIVPDSD
jgi:hypothetical protein